MSEDREYSNIYTIPPNYTDSGKLLGGMLETRNTVEAGILLVLVGYPELMWLHLPVTAKVVVMTITLLPLTVFALMGLGGDSLLQQRGRRGPQFAGLCDPVPAQEGHRPGGGLHARPGRTRSQP